MNQRADFILKLLILGDYGIGKSTMMNRYVNDIYDPHYTSTIGVDFKVVYMNIKGYHVKLQLWDTAGQERFRSIVRSYYRNTNGFVLCFDLSNRQTFNNLKEWLHDLDLYGGSHIPRMLVGLKSDANRSVTNKEAQTFADLEGLNYVEISSKNNSADDMNELIFMDFAEILLNQTLEYIPKEEPEILVKSKKTRRFCTIL